MRFLTGNADWRPIPVAESTVHFDLSKQATRKQLFGTVVLPLDDTQRARVGRVVGDLSIRNEEQLHDIGEVERAIDRTVASEGAKGHAKEVYRILAQAEAQVHGCLVEETHFHEVGKGLTVREVLGICTALECLAPAKVTATAVQVGSGTVECAHGVLDVPAPATAAIIEAHDIPVAPERLEGERCTPTSAALIAHFVDEFV